MVRRDFSSVTLTRMPFHIGSWLQLNWHMKWQVIMLQNFSVKPHEIQTVSTSLNFYDSLNIIRVMNAWVWIGRHTFDHFHFQDMAVGTDCICRIQRVIALQHVVSLR